MKRLLDIAAATVGLLLLSPLLLVIGVMVTAGSRGGPLFRQVRVGRHRRCFRVMKFRTMTVRAGTEAGGFEAGDTRRVTSVGRVLRRTKLDELPQLWNVLVGDMSLVGPRPEVPSWTEVHRTRWDAVLSVRPGITDPASIEFRNEEAILAAAEDPEACYRDVILPRKLELAERYVRKRTMWGDLGILLRTFTGLLGIGSRPGFPKEPGDRTGSLPGDAGE